MRSWYTGSSPRSRSRCRYRAMAAAARCSKVGMRTSRRSRTPARAAIAPSATRSVRGIDLRLGGEQRLLLPRLDECIEAVLAEHPRPLRIELAAVGTLGLGDAGVDADQDAERDPARRDQAERDPRTERVADGAIAARAGVRDRREVRIPTFEHRAAAAMARQRHRDRLRGELPVFHDLIPVGRVAGEAVDQGAAHQVIGSIGATTSLINSWRVDSCSRNTPRTPLVTSRASWAPTPRAAMHM